MRSAISEFELLQPRDLRHALRLLSPSNGAPPPTPFAGGTDLMVHLNAGTLRERRFINLWDLNELRGIRARGGVLAIGALTTWTEIRRSPLVRRHAPALAAAAREIGAIQIQNRGTIGGNIVNASPAGDSLPVLAVYDAVLVLRGARSSRDVPFNEFYTGYRATVRRPGELLVEIRIPLPSLRGARQWFRKIGTRRAQAISKVSAAGVMREEKDGRVERVRFALGSVAPTVVRARHAEAVLVGQRPTPRVLKRAVEALQRDISPIDDIRSTAEYRRRVAGVLLRRFLRSP